MRSLRIACLPFGWCSFFCKKYRAHHMSAVSIKSSCIKEVKEIPEPLSFSSCLRYGLQGCVCSLGDSMWRQYICYVCAFWFAIRRCCHAPGHVYETDSGARQSPGTCGRRLHLRLPPLWLWRTNAWEWLPHPGQGMTDPADWMYCFTHCWYLNCDYAHE